MGPALRDGIPGENSTRTSKSDSLLMKMPRRASSLLLTVMFLLCHTAVGLSLRDQLALAEKDEDTHAQIELIRRILDEKPDDDELRERLADLWLSVEDYDMAESTVREWTDAPESVRVRVFGTVLFVRDQKKEEAVALLEGYLAGHPDDLEITRQLAGYLDGMGEDQKVVDLLSKAPGVEEDASLLVSRALARRKLQDFASALKDFAAAERLDSEDESVVRNRPSFERLRAALAGIDAAGAILAGKPDDLSARLFAGLLVFVHRRREWSGFGGRGGRSAHRLEVRSGAPSLCGGLESSWTLSGPRCARQI